MLLQLAVFDLDMCVWKPEMYQLNGPPMLTPISKFEPKKKRKQSRNQIQQNQRKLSPTIRKGQTVTDRTGTEPITIFDGASYALRQLQQMENVQTAIASSTDEPSWALQCLRWFVLEEEEFSNNNNNKNKQNKHGGVTTTTLADCFDHVEIRFGDKQRHFEQLQRKTQIPFENMCFFDDTYRNIQSVSQLGVKCVWTPKGMTRDQWNEALDLF